MVCDRTDGAEFGEAAMNLLHSHIDRYLALRPGLEGEHTFIDISFKDIVEDAYAAAGICFESHGLPYNADVQSRIQAWEQANPTPAPGQHAYNLDRYGLTTEAIHTRFQKYYERCDQTFPQFKTPPSTKPEY